MSESKNFWVYIETEHGKAKNASYELITAAKPLAEKREIGRASCRERV